MNARIDGSAPKYTQSAFARGLECHSCATSRPAFFAQLSQGKNDAAAMFKQNPHQTANALSLFYHEAHKELPAVFRDADLSHNGKDIRTLIGVIYSEVMDSGNEHDIATLKKVCNKLMDAEGRGESRERKVSGKVSALAEKYISPASEKLINQYIEHCIDAWEIDHQGRGVDTETKAIFKPCLDVCKGALMDRVDALMKPDKSWETMAQLMRQVASSCSAISKTMIAHLNDAAKTEAEGPEGGNPAANSEPDGPGTPGTNADIQRILNEKGGLTLNITSQGGSVGDITHSIAAAPAGTGDNHAASVKHILDSGLSNEQKVDVLKALFQPNAGGVLHNLTGVQGFKPRQNPLTQEADQQSVATQPESMDEVDSGISASQVLAEEVMREAFPTDVESPVIAEQEYIADVVTDSFTAEDEILESVSPSYAQELTHAGEWNNKPVVTNIKMEAMPQQAILTENVSDTNHVVQSEEHVAKIVTDSIHVATAEEEILESVSPGVTQALIRPDDVKEVISTSGNHNAEDIEPSVVTQQQEDQAEIVSSDHATVRPINQRGLLPKTGASAAGGAVSMMEELQNKFATLKDRDASAFDTLEIRSAGSQSAMSNKDIAASTEDAVEGGSVQRDSSRTERFQPAQFIARTAARHNPTVYTTVRTVDIWKSLNGVANHSITLPAVPESGENELDKKFADLGKRRGSAFDFLSEKKMEQKKEQLAFQKKLAEFKRRV